MKAPALMAQQALFEFQQRLKMMTFTVSHIGATPQARSEYFAKVHTSE